MGYCLSFQIQGSFPKEEGGEANPSPDNPRTQEKMTPGLVSKFLRKMLGPRWPKGFDPIEKEWLMRDTEVKEIHQYAPELLREKG